MQTFQERRPASYDQEQEPDGAVDLLSDAGFSFASVSGTSQTGNNEQHDLLNHACETDESVESGEDTADWLDEPGDSIGGAAFRMVSSNSLEEIGTEENCQRSSAGGECETLSQVTDKGGALVPGQRRGSNLEALGNLGALRAKLNAAVQRQEHEPRPRMLSMQARANALEYLQNEVDAAPLEPKGVQITKNSLNEPALARTNAADNDTDGSKARADSKQKSVDLLLAEDLPSPAVASGRKSRIVFNSPETTKPAEDNHGANSAGFTRSNEPCSRVQPASMFDVASVKRIFRPRGANMREYRTLPDQPGWQSSEPSMPSQPNENSIALDEKPECADEENESLGSVPSQSHLKRRSRSQLSSKSPAKVEFQQLGLAAESPPPSSRKPLRSHGRQSQGRLSQGMLSPSRLSQGKVSHGRPCQARNSQGKFASQEDQAPVSMRRRISNVLVRGSSESRKNEGSVASSKQIDAVHSGVSTRSRKKVPSSMPMSPVTSHIGRKKTVFQFAME